MGKRFVFDLEPVLELRRRAEQEQQRRVAGFERQRVAVEDRLRDCQRTIISAKADLRAQLAPGGGPRAVSLQGVRLQANASLHMLARAQGTVLELAGVHHRLSEARAELLKAAASRKAVELLRAKRFEAWKREQARLEQAEIEEINVMHAARRALSHSAAEVTP